MFENLRGGRQARNFTTNVPKILDLKSSSEQIFFRKLSLGAPDIIKNLTKFPVIVTRRHACQTIPDSFLRPHQFCPTPMPCTVKFMGSFTIEDGDISENVAIKKTSLFSNFVAIISTRWKCQMSVNFNWIVFLETDPKFRRRKKSLSGCVFVLHKTSNYTLTQGKNHHL